MYTVKEGCPGCGSCQHVCPVGAIEQEGIGVKINSKCIDCGICAANCPIKLIDRGAAPEEKQAEPERSDV